jgi:hypothetical protein
MPPRAHRAVSNLKAWLHGTHRWTSPGHLPAYLDEYVFRHTRRGSRTPPSRRCWVSARDMSPPPIRPPEPRRNEPGMHFCARAPAPAREVLDPVIIPYLCFSLPLAIYILVSFFKEIPKDLEEAALVDGATNFEAFTKVVIPLAAPGMATAAILTFIAAWNEFLFAVTLTSTPKARTVPAAIAFFTGSTEFEKPLGTISAASVIISIPLILLVLFFQKRIVAGLTAGAVKG